MASDQGVTEDAIKVGFLVAQLGGLDATGFALGLRGDQREAIKAYVDHANAEGGVNGRRIDYVVEESDPLSASSMRQACLRMADDHKVFAVMDTAATIGIGHACYAEKQLPHVFTSAQTVNEQLFLDGRGYNVSTGGSGSRAILNWASFMLDEGFIGAGKGKLGILSDECAPAPDIMDREFKPYLQEHGVEFQDVRLTCDYGLAQQQTPGAVLTMRQNNVDRVLLAVIFSSAQSFLQSAQAQGWKPAAGYSVSDIWGLNLDFSANNFPPAQFDRTRGVSYSFSGAERAGIPYNEAVQRCSQILQDAGLPGITDQMDSDAEVLSLCGSFELFLAAARKAPTNLTRTDWIAGIESLGEVPSTYSQRAIYGPAKYNAGDSYSLVEWQRECGCFLQIRPHAPARL